jgi:hypothetical protein
MQPKSITTKRLSHLRSSPWRPRLNSDPSR